MSDPQIRLQAILLSKEWFGFDLDDTLHEFRKASSQASRSVFKAIHSSDGISIDELQATYQEILRTATAHAFTDRRSSTDYRRERFTRLLEVHGVNDGTISDLNADSIQNGKIGLLLNIYQSSLRSNFALKAGVLDLLHTLKHPGKKIIVITEGPADAQESTIRELGLRSYVNVLVTTNEVGRSKIDGLSEIVLQKYDIAAKDIVYFGDNKVRDVQAAQENEILAVLYHEGQESHFHDLRALTLESWDTLRALLVDGH